MGRTLEEKLAKLPAARRSKIVARTAVLVAQERSLRDLRRAQALTQKHMARTLGIGQESISKLENRSDMMLSTLKNYVEAMGGRLDLIVQFPDRPPVALSGFGPAGAGIVRVVSRSKRKSSERKRAGA